MLLLQITEGDKLTKDVCDFCQNKLELCRQYFEQIYNAHVKLLSLLREGEEEANENAGDTGAVSFEDEMMQYMRSYADRERPEQTDGDQVVFNQPREIVKCEPEIPGLHEPEAETAGTEKRDTEELGDPKHFLDELLDEYENMDEMEKSPRGKSGKKKAKLLVPPPLKKCGVCGLVSSSHLENLAHWAAEHPGTEVV